MTYIIVHLYMIFFSINHPSKFINILKAFNMLLRFNCVIDSIRVVMNWIDNNVHVLWIACQSVSSCAIAHCLPYMSPEAGPIRRKDKTIDLARSPDLATMHANIALSSSFFFSDSFNTFIDFKSVNLQYTN